MTTAVRTVRTPERKQALLASLQQGATIVAACQAANIGRSTFWDWRQADPDFAAEVDQAEQAAVLVVEDAMMRAIVSEPAKCQTLVMFWLQNRAPDRWQDRRNLHVQQNVTVETQLDRDIADLAEQLGVADSPLVKAALNGHDS